jgi:hypothetical protein
MKTKYCKRCDNKVDVKLFTKCASRYDGLQPYCKECMKLYRIEHYRKNKPAHYKRNQKSHEKLRQIILDVKNTGSCYDCKQRYPNEPWLLEFDHRVPSDKISVVERLVKYGNKEKLLREIEKCDLLCVLCHRRRTAKMFGWKPNRYTINASECSKD